ncbi:MAG: thioredoxin-dependent thiol peroxidase [Fimbriimonadaceae bacterium]|nr:thioredoxin-dependent thiol peroxidase [Fimbriimonadaceae bacterium]
MIDVGSPFPDFVLQDQDGKTWTKNDLYGSKTIVYFYPKDDTAGCTTEACEFRDLLPEFSGAKVYGVSPDPVKKHRKFADKFELNFPLLADTDKFLCDTLGIWVKKTLYGKKYMGIERTTYLLDEKGVIEKVWRQVKIEGHAAEVLSALS